jgi:ketosteroid isomerase-like protein
MKRLNLVAPVLFSLAIALGACAPAGSQESPELAQAGERWIEAFNAGDLDALAAMYAEDTWLLPPNGEMAQGRDVVRAAFGAMIDAGQKAELETVEAIAAGDIGYKLGTFKALGPDGSVMDKGKFIEVWKQVGGEWKIMRDIWNSDMPAPSLMITHNVADADHWLAAWKGPDSRHGMFAQHGAPSVRVFQSLQDPSLMGLLIGVTDMDSFQALLESPQGAAAKAEDGVIDASLQVFSEVQ